jgi:hypothetical protein
MCHLTKSFKDKVDACPLRLIPICIRSSKQDKKGGILSVRLQKHKPSSRSTILFIWSSVCGRIIRRPIGKRIDKPASIPILSTISAILPAIPRLSSVWWLWVSILMNAKKLSSRVFFVSLSIFYGFPQRIFRIRWQQSILFCSFIKVTVKPFGVYESCGFCLIPVDLINSSTFALLEL